MRKKITKESVSIKKSMSIKYSLNDNAVPNLQIDSFILLFTSLFFMTRNNNVRARQWLSTPLIPAQKQGIEASRSL